MVFKANFSNISAIAWRYIKFMIWEKHTYLIESLYLFSHYSYEIVSPADNSYGSLEEDGTWNGMVGMVMRKACVFILTC